MTEPHKDARWTDERCDQLTAMWDLWRIARVLNHSPDIVGNAKKLEELSGKIGGTGFLLFLNDEAIRDRIGDKP